jgi:hypothetical protein
VHNEWDDPMAILIKTRQVPSKIERRSNQNTTDPTESCYG